MGILYNRLLITLNDSDPDSTDYHIALVMLQHMTSLSSLSIQELARLCNVSKSTISKFIRVLGYEDFADFRNAAVFRDNKYDNPFNFVHDVLGFLKNNPGDSYLLTLLRDMQESYASLDWTMVDRLVVDLASHERVGAFGMMFSESAALDFQIKLGYSGKFIITNLNDRKQMHFLRHADENTLVIIFSDSGDYINRYSNIQDFIRKNDFDDTKAKVVLITSNPRAAQDPRIAYSILYRRTGTLHTHRIVYQMLTDLIAYKYRTYVETNGKIFPAVKD